MTVPNVETFFRGLFAFVSGFLAISAAYFYFAVEEVRWLLVYSQFFICVCWFGLVWIYVATEKRYEAILAFVLTATAVAEIVIAFADVYRILGIVDASTKTLSYDPVSCLYFSIVTFTTLGYGDFIPSADLRLVAAMEAFVGYFTLALVIAVFSHLWGRIVKNSN